MNVELTDLDRHILGLGLLLLCGRGGMTPEAAANIKAAAQAIGKWEIVEPALNLCLAFPAGAEP